MPDFDELMLRSLQGLAEEDEERLLKAWLHASAENRTRFEELREIFDIAESAIPQGQSVRRPSARELLREAVQRVPGPVEPHVRARGDRRRVRWLAPLATAAAIGALAFGIHVFQFAPQPEPAPLFTIGEFTTGPREAVTVRLGDKTIVRLGPRSTIQVDGTGGKRDVWLEGEAFFAVAEDPDVPFTVRTPAGTATVLGTRFDVRAREKDLRLVVVDGRVRLAAGPAGEYVEEVGPSQVAQIAETGHLYVTEVPDVYALLEWMEDALVFQVTPLERVARELEYRYGVPVSIVDSAVVGRTITAGFTDETLETAVTVICRAANVTCSVSEAGVRIGLGPSGI